jgi:hypothetical protein
LHKEEIMMKKIIGFIFVVALLCLIGAVPAMAAGTPVGGGGVTYIGKIAGSTTSVNTSNNVYLIYVTANSGQNYGASSKHMSGDRCYGTGGGNGAATNIYYEAGQAVGNSTPLDPTDLITGVTTGWSAQ